MLRPLRSLLLFLTALACLPSLAAVESAGPSASASLGTSCTPRSVQAVHGYVRELMPQLAAVLLSSTLVEEALAQLQAPGDIRLRWQQATPEVRKQVQAALERETYALRDQVRQHVAARFAQLPWVSALKLDCTDYDRLARRMSQADARSYFELERMTMDASLGLGVQGVPFWLELSSPAERNEHMDEAIGMAKNMPAYPFMFDGRAAFNALALLGLRHADDARSAAWMAEVRRVMTGPGSTRFHKTDEARELRGIITDGIDNVVRSAYDANSRAMLKTDFERRLAAGLMPLNPPATP